MTLCRHAHMPRLLRLRTAEASRKRREKRKRLKRYLLIGLATVGGGTVIGECCLASAEMISLHPLHAKRLREKGTARGPVSLTGA